MKRVLLTTLLLCSIVSAAWDKTKPADDRDWDLVPGDIRANWAALETALSSIVDLTDAATDVNVVTAYNVKAFGADDTGATDSTTAIQAAINAAEAAGGGTVYMPVGTYVGTVTLPKAVSLVGENGLATLEAVSAGEYAVTQDYDSGGAPHRIHGIKFLGASQTKSGVRVPSGPAGGYASLQIDNCTFYECDESIYITDRFYWLVQNCFFTRCNYDVFSEGTGLDQAASGRILGCYSNGNKVAAVRMKNVQYEVVARDCVIEATEGFAVYDTGNTLRYNHIYENIHGENNASEATVTLDGSSVTTYEYYFSTGRNIVIRNAQVQSIYAGTGSTVLLDRVTMDASDYTVACDSSSTITARDFVPYSTSTAGTAVNDIYALSRAVAYSSAVVQVAEGPLADRQNFTRTNKLIRGSMARDFAVAAAGTGNTIDFSGAYAAPIHGRCMTILFNAAGQAYTDGTRIYGNMTITTGKWFVWSLDLKASGEGYLSLMWRATTGLQSQNMKADSTQWRRYWGVAYNSASTSSVSNYVWNAHASLNPTFYIANMQLIEFDTAQEAQAFLNEAAYVPGTNDPRPWHYDLSLVYSVAADVTDFNDVGTTVLNSASGAITGALADGAAVGQRVRFVCKTAGNNIDISVSHHVTSDPEVIRLDTALEYVELVWDGTDWVEVGGSGQTYP